MGRYVLAWSKWLIHHRFVQSALSIVPVSLANRSVTNHCRGLYLASAVASSKKDSVRWVRDDAKTAAEALKHADARNRAKVALQDEHSEVVKTCTLVEAEAYAKQRNMKVTLVDEKKLPKVYRLISNEELSALKEAEKVSKNDKKENKVRKISSSIAEHDLNIKLRDVLQLVVDGYSVALHVSYSGEEVKDESRKEQIKTKMTAKISDVVSAQAATVRLSQSGASFFVLTVSKTGPKPPAPK